MHWLVACVCWFESDVLNDSMSFKTCDKFYKSSINAGDVLTHDACNASSSGVKDGALGDETGGREVAAYRKFLDTQAYPR